MAHHGPVQWLTHAKRWPYIKSGTYTVNSRTCASNKTLDLEFSLADGSTLRGKLFVPVQGRLTDVLNDERKFLPVEQSDGELLARGRP